MRVFIVFDGVCEPFDISHKETAGAVKQMVKKSFHMPPSDDTQTRRSLQLRYAGATLQDDWALAPLGIRDGSTVQCYLREETQPVLYVFCTVRGHSLPIQGSPSLLTSPVSTLRSVVSVCSGLPVGAFTLTTSGGVVLYDCHRPQDYGVDIGHTLQLHTWGGWGEFLRGCFHGNKHTVQSHLSKERPVMRFQLRVALYVSAALGHLALARWLLSRGARGGEAVGVHPYREWCRATAHPDCAKSPTVAAVESGRLVVLNALTSSSALCLTCRGPRAESLLQLAIRHRHPECASHLLSKLASTASFPDLSLPMGIYIPLLRWLQRARGRASAGGPFKTRVGDPVFVDGFIMEKMSSKPREERSKVSLEVKGASCSFPALTSLVASPSCLPLHPVAPVSHNAPVALPQLHPVSESTKGEKTGARRRGCEGERWKDIPKDENREGRGSPWRRREPVPRPSRDDSPQLLYMQSSPTSSHLLTSSLDSFTRVCGRSPGQNAAQCLALASTFTDKPWLQRLALARTLARRSVRDAL